MDITEALVRGPSGNSQNKDLDVGLSDASTTDNTVTVGTRAYEPRTEDEEQQKREDRRSGIIGWPTSERVADGPNSASEVLEHRYLEGDDRVSGLWNGSADPFAPNSAPAIHHVSTSPIAGGSALARNAVMGTPDPKAPADGLRSHPSVMAKVMRPAQQERSRSKVGFSLRADTEAARQAGKKWEKEDVISTPYPIPYEGDKEGGWERNQRKEKGKWASLTVLVYKRGGGMPKVTRLKIPSVGHEIFSSVMSGKPQEGGTVAMNQTFDDAKLALLLRGAYTSFRGPVLAKCGARTVCSVRLLGYTSWCQLATRRAKQQCFETKEQKDEESGFAEARLLELYRKPKIGNGKWEWWNWARGLPENQAVGVQGEARLERVALEIVEGWSARRIILAFSLVAICSVVACLLWIFAGVNRTATGEPLKGSPNAAGQSLPSEPNSSTIGQSSSHDGIAITGSHSTPSQVPTTVPGADTALFGIPSDALGPGSAAASLSAIINANGPTPTVIQRDTSSASLSTESSTVTSTNIPASAGQQPEAYLSGGPGSRVTAGVVLGLLVLLVGWMFLGAWLALSWTTG
ncbi:uncharacterized protein KY384_007066 [Bacidia gigantensis]|uniref:uncharacterized protein n=1 Tax=Bacidia gigantensis TaxID=2732470 RepID=UPI001D038587|nr:uncharacterized protein KY384_007066 [Bacidia gigantensis]KAG8528150.1 hypothetical protein KY384_007066 [Bacidia gigantensis]